MTTTSRGTGEVIAAAVDGGCRRIVLGIGGSACTDGGSGLLQALGARLLDADGEELSDGGAALVRSTSRSAVSRRFVAATETALGELASARK